jgi:hypothetical protein
MQPIFRKATMPRMAPRYGICTFLLPDIFRFPPLLLLLPSPYLQRISDKSQQNQTHRRLTACISFENVRQNQNKIHTKKDWSNGSEAQRPHLPLYSLRLIFHGLKPTPYLQLLQPTPHCYVIKDKPSHSRQEWPPKRKARICLDRI